MNFVGICDAFGELRLAPKVGIFEIMPSRTNGTIGSVYAFLPKWRSAIDPSKIVSESELCQKHGNSVVPKMLKTIVRTMLVFGFRIPNL